MMDEPFSKSSNLDSLLPRQSSSTSFYQTIGVFLVSPSCSWKKLELNFKKSTYLTEFQPRFIKLNTTRSVFTSAKVYYCWSVPQQSPSQTAEETLNLVFICGESLSTCVLIHTSLKKEASMKRSDSEICERLPTDFEIDCVLFYFDDASKELDDSRMQRWLHRHLSNYPSPTRDSLFIGIVSVNQSKSDEQLRTSSEASQQPKIDFFNVKCFYLHLYQLIRTLINFRLKMKLPLFYNQLTPVNSDCAINGQQRKQSLHEYESLNVTASDNSAEYEKAVLPVKHNGFTLGSSDEDSNSRNQLLSLSLSTQSAQTYFATMRTQASQTDIALPSGRSSDNDVFAKSENEDDKPAGQCRQFQKLSLSFEPRRNNLINQSADFGGQHRTLPRKDDSGKLRNLSSRGDFPWQIKSLDGVDDGTLKNSQLSLRFGRSCEMLDWRDERKQPLKFSSFKNVRRPNWPLNNALVETQNNDPKVSSSNYSVHDEPSKDNEHSSSTTSNNTKDGHPQKYLTYFEKQHLVPWQPSQENSKKSRPRPPPLSMSRETVKKDLSQTQMTSTFSDIASKSTLSDNTLEFTTEKSSCASPRRKMSLEQFRQHSIDEEKVSKFAASTPSSELVRPAPKYPERHQDPQPGKPGDVWPALYSESQDTEVGKIKSLPKRQLSENGPVEPNETTETEIAAENNETGSPNQLYNSLPAPRDSKEEPERRKAFFHFARSKSPIDLQKFINGKDASKNSSKRQSSLSGTPFQAVPFDEFQYLDNSQVAKIKQRRHSEFPQSPFTQYAKEEAPSIKTNHDGIEVAEFTEDESKLESPISPKSFKLSNFFGLKKDPGQASKGRSHSESRVTANNLHPNGCARKDTGHERSKRSNSNDSEKSQEQEAGKIGRERKSSKSPYAASQTSTCLDPAMSKQLVTPLLGMKSPKHSGEKRDHDKDEPKKRTSSTSKTPKSSKSNPKKKKKSTSKH